MSGSARLSIAVAVVVDGGRVLVGRRSSTAVDAPGRDEFPGGLVEPGESADTAASRECAEEAAVTVAVERLLCSAAAASSRGPVEIHFFRCRPLSGRSPRAPFAWMPIAELARCDFPAANAKVVRLLLAETGAGAGQGGSQPPRLHG